MDVRAFLAIAIVTLTGCAAIPFDDPSTSELRAAEREAAADRRALRAVEAQNQLLASEIAGEREAASERAELARRLDALERSNAKVADAGARSDEPPKVGAPTDEPAPSATINSTDVELRRLRAKLAEAGFGPYTLTPAEVRALLRVLKPPRPIDPESPFGS